MPRFPRWVAAAILVAPLLVHAQELGLKLRLQQNLLVTPAVDDGEETPLFLEADNVSGTQGVRLDANGDVRIRERGRTIIADHLHYTVQDEQITATGNVRLDRLGDVIESDKLFLDMKNDQGYAESPEYYFKAFRARGKAAKLIIDSRTQYRAEDGTYSTCEVPEKDWYLRVGKLKLDRGKDKGTARNARLVFKGWPVLYTPYLDFPLSNARKTGFLAPTYGTTGKSGFEFTLPFYLNLAPNYDLTVAPRVLAKRGVLVNNEFRYITPNLSGLLNAEYLESDRERQGESRYALAFRHNQNFMPGLSGYLNVQKVSDDQYFVDLSNRISVTSLRTLPREGSLSYSRGWWTTTARTQSFQTLQDPNAPITPPYARLPQLTASALRPDIKGFDLGFQAEYVSFSHPTLVAGQRTILYPSVSYPLQTSFVTVVPKLGLHYTNYSLDGTTGITNATRTLPIFSLDSSVTFERNTNFFSRAFVQTLEPRMYYVYIPYRNQDQLPVFDTAIADFNLAQIFTENQFVGGDRINDANQLTTAISSRLITPEDGQERLRMTLAQRFFFKGQQVTLPNVDARTQSRSDVLAALNGRMSEAWYTDFAINYDLSQNRHDRTTLAFRYNPEPGRVFNIGYRFNRDSFEQADISAQWPINDKWSGVGRFAYSLRDARTVATIAGVEYNAGCWAARFVVQQFVTLTQDSVRALFFQIEFNGLSKLGSNPIEILRQNVGGYQRLNAVPQSQLQSDYYPAQ
ncbi:MAG: LPS-assembly protein LptD [Betaproteobacteria bacterium]